MSNVVLFGLFALMLLCHTNADNRALRRRLLENYDRFSRPVRRSQDTVVVRVGMTPLYVEGLDEEKQQLITKSWVLMTWRDEYLVWNPRDVLNQQVVTFSPDEVWLPDIRIYNGDQEVDRTLVLVYHNGTVIWVPPITYRSKCSLNHDHYPVDSQACNITLGSWTQHNNSISIVPSDSYGERIQNDNPHWNVTSIKRNFHVKYYDCCIEPYGVLNYALRMSRRAPPLWQVVWGPCVALCLLTLAMFWVPPSRAAAKLGLGGAITVALAVLVSKDIAATHAESLVFPTMLTVAVAIMAEVGVVSLLRVAGPAPSLLVKLADSAVGTALAITAGDGEWGMVAQILDRVLCLIFLVAIVAQQASHD